MKLTKAKSKWVNDKVRHYCSLLEIEPPKVFLTMAEYNVWKKAEREKTGFKRVGRSQCLGVCHRKEHDHIGNGFIVILVKRLINTKALDSVIRHELIHYAKPSYNHRSQAFADKMKLLKQGKVKNGRFYN